MHSLTSSSSDGTQALPDGTQPDPDETTSDGASDAPPAATSLAATSGLMRFDQLHRHRKHGKRKGL